MMPNDNGHLENLQGRIIALELLMRCWLTGEAMSSDDPLTTIQAMRDEMLGSLQNTTRPIDDASDAIWGEAADALNDTFEQAAVRVRYHLSR